MTPSLFICSAVKQLLFRRSGHFEMMQPLYLWLTGGIKQLALCMTVGNICQLQHALHNVVVLRVIKKAHWYTYISVKKVLSIFILSVDTEQTNAGLCSVMLWLLSVTSWQGFYK